RGEALFRFRDGSVVSLKRTDFKALPRALLNLKAKRRQVMFNRDFTTAEFEYAGRKVLLEGPSESPLFFAEHLFLGGGEYPAVDVRGRVVVDVGANIGDTAIYFALNGASKVVAFEPFSDLAAMARKNILRNGLGKNVEIVEAGVSNKTASIHLENGGGAHSASSQVSEGASPGKSKIELLSLSDVVEKYAISEAVLKLDCEGAEYGIILDAGAPLLRRFRAILVEYHYGYENLAKKLESAGFKVRLHGPPKYDFNPGWKHPLIRVGVLLAERTD
ncbi:MAG: FkbM family methyltransferase, partial [Candidatus Micrarchaeia archaeon]